MMNQSAIFGTILSAGENKNMIVELENGERGVVTFSEVGRRNLAEDFPVQLMIGKRLGFVPGELNADGLRELSARRYEDQMLDQIRADFESRTRNVYPAELVSVTPNVAYYRIAQGVNGGVTTGDFAYSFVPSFTMPGMHLPRRATAVVKQIYDTGRIDLTLRPAFGDFEQNVDRLGLEADCEFEAPVVYRAKMASSNVAMLSPNLTVLCGDAPVGGVVRMRCTNIDREAHRIYAETTEKYVRAAAVFDYEACMLSPEELGDYVDVEAFEARLRPVRAAAKPAPKPVEIDFCIPPNTTSSPFGIEAGETVVHERRPFNNHALLRDIESGVLDERHRQVCRAVCDLRYANMYLIQRYLCAKHGVMIGTAPLKNILTRLTELNILAMMHFRREGGARSTPVYICGGQYRNFMSEYPRLQAWEYTNEDASIPKTRLASNQLLIALMHSRNVTEHDPHPYILFDEKTPQEIRVRPRHRIVMDGKVCYLEGVRSDWDFDSFANKLLRYQQAFDRTGEDAEVLVAVETREIAIELAARVEVELNLGYTVRFCADLDALPEPQFITANPTRKVKTEAEPIEKPKGLFNKLKLRFLGSAA